MEISARDGSARRARRFPQKEEEEGFIDFGKIPVVSNQPDTLPDESVRDAVKSSKFAAITNTNVVYIKRIHDKLLKVCDDEAAQSSANAPKFLEMDLSRIINLTLIQLDLQPSKTEDEGRESSWNIESDSVSALKSTIAIQNSLMAELGKKMDAFNNYNIELVEYNKKLISERNIAYQTRDELHALLDKERKQNKEANDKNTWKRRREYFDHVSMIDQAYESFKSLQKQHANNFTPVEIDNLKPTSIDLPEEPVLFKSVKSSISYAGVMLANEKEFEAPSKLEVSLKAQTELNHRMRNNPYHNVRSRIPRRISVSNYHSNDFKSILNRVNKFVGTISSHSIKENRELLECQSIEEYLKIVNVRLQELEFSLNKTLDVLADEQRNSNQWRLKAEHASKKLESISEEMHELLKRANLHSSCINSQLENLKISKAETKKVIVLPFLGSDDLILTKSCSQANEKMKKTKMPIYVPSNL